MKSFEDQLLNSSLELDDDTPVVCADPRRRRFLAGAGALGAAASMPMLLGTVPARAATEAGYL